MLTSISDLDFGNKLLGLGSAEAKDYALAPNKNSNNYY